MKILHYTLGFTPARSGGLVQYATDVMTEESFQGHDVIALYPGNLNFVKRTAYIRKAGSRKHNFKIFELINSLPLPLFGGIQNPDDFMKRMPKSVFKEFLLKIHPDIIHVHTLMGLPIEFFVAAKELKIKVIYTTHDYFGLAPEPNFYKKNMSYDSEDTVSNWIEASQGSYSTKKLRIFQLSIYPVIKKVLKVIKLTRKQKNSIAEKQKTNDTLINEYKNLMQYYRKMFLMVDGFHFNSNVTKQVFEKVLGSNLPGEVISITDSAVSHIKNQVSSKTFSDKMKIAYIGPDLALSPYTHLTLPTIYSV